MVVLQKKARSKGENVVRAGCIGLRSKSVETETNLPPMDSSLEPVPLTSEALVVHGICMAATVLKTQRSLTLFNRRHIGQLYPQKDKTDRMQCQMSLSKKQTCKGTLRHESSKSNIFKDKCVIRVFICCVKTTI